MLNLVCSQEIWRSNQNVEVEGPELKGNLLSRSPFALRYFGRATLDSLEYRTPEELLTFYPGNVDI